MVDDFIYLFLSILLGMECFKMESVTKSKKSSIHDSQIGSKRSLVNSLIDPVFKTLDISKSPHELKIRKIMS